MVSVQINLNGIFYRNDPFIKQLDTLNKIRKIIYEDLTISYYFITDEKKINEKIINEMLFKFWLNTKTKNLKIVNEELKNRINKLLRINKLQKIVKIIENN